MDETEEVEDVAEGLPEELGDFAFDDDLDDDPDKDK